MRNRWLRALVFTLAGVAALYVAFASSEPTPSQAVVAQRSTCTTTATQ